MVMSLVLACREDDPRRAAPVERDAAVVSGIEVDSGAGGAPLDTRGSGGGAPDTASGGVGAGDASAMGGTGGKPDAARDSAPTPADTAPLPADAAPVPADTAAAGGPFQILILSKTLEYHHDSIPACQQLLRELGETADADLPGGARPGSQWTVTVASEDLSDFTDAGLRRYAMLFWCNPTGTVFSSAGATGATAKAAIQRFLTTGGAWGGVHSATDFENTQGWPWFQEQVNGGNFVSHDSDGTSDTIVWQPGPVATDHPVIRGIKSPWACADEWYALNRDPETLPGFTVLGKLGSDQRPAVYVREIPGGGRSFYTVRGHGTGVYEEPNFRRLIHQGILWAVRRIK
jgi:hypothetical protein